MLRLPTFILAVALAMGPERARNADPASTLRAYPADSLVAPLRSREARRDRPAESAAAALLLGQLHYARGEYRQAAGAFGRAAVRLEPARRSEARYWVGLSWLGAGEGPQARGVLDEIGRSGSPRRAASQLAIAQAWELEGRPDRAAETLERLLASPAGETGPAALDCYAALAERLHRAEPARRARDRLLREYPQSMEAARARLAAFQAAPGAGATGAAVQLGAFSDATRARALAEQARRAGFNSVQVSERRGGSERLFVVRLGGFAGRAEAERAGEQAARMLGTSYRLVGPP